MDFRSTAAHSSRIRKSTKPPTLKRNASSPLSALARRKPVQRSKTKPEVSDDDEDYFDEQLDDIGLVKTLATDLTLRDVAQAIQYTRGKMWSAMPDQRTGMNSTRIAEVLNFRASFPPVVTVSHVQALLNSPTAVEREIDELMRGGAIRKVVVTGRGKVGEILILMKDYENMVEKIKLDDGSKEEFIRLLRENPSMLKLPRSRLSEKHAKTLMHTGFITSSMGEYTTTEHFSKPGDGSRGTLTSLISIERAASSSQVNVGSEGAVHASGGSGGRARQPAQGDYTIAIPAAGHVMKFLTDARLHFMSLLSKSKHREAPESLLKERWDGGVVNDEGTSAAKRSRGEFAGVLPGRTRKWKTFNGMSFEFILSECVGAGLVEVFNTRSIGRGVRAL